MGKDRRRHPRAEIQLDVTVDAAGREWPGKTVNLSPFGAKVVPLAKSPHLPPGTKVELRLRPHDQDQLSVPATVKRMDRDGVALNFDSLGEPEFQQLKRLVDAAQKHEWQEVLTELGVQPLPAEGVASAGQSVVPPEGAPGTTGAEGSEIDRWQAVLSRLGMEGLQLPREGPLTPQWLEFLRRLEADTDQGESKGRPRPR